MFGFDRREARSSSSVDASESTATKGGGEAGTGVANGGEGEDGSEGGGLSSRWADAAFTILNQQCVSRDGTAKSSPVQPFATVPSSHAAVQPSHAAALDASCAAAIGASAGCRDDGGAARSRRCGGRLRRAATSCAEACVRAAHPHRIARVARVSRMAAALTASRREAGRLQPPLRHHIIVRTGPERSHAASRSLLWWRSRSPASTWRGGSPRRGAFASSRPHTRRPARPAAATRPSEARVALLC